MNIEIQFKKIKKAVGEFAVTDIEFHAKNILFVTVVNPLFATVINPFGEYIFILRVKEDGELEYLFSPEKSLFSGEVKRIILDSLK